MKIDERIITEEEYLSKKGFPFMGYVDASLHHGYTNKTNKNRRINGLLKDSNDYDKKRVVLRKEYYNLVKKGELRKPTPLESLLIIANREKNESNSEQIEAAKRLLLKRGVTNFNIEQIKF